MQVACDFCEHTVEIDDVEGRYYALADAIEEIADLLARGHADEAYRMLSEHYEIGSLETRRITTAAHGRPAHLL